MTAELQISNSGRLLRIKHANGRIIAEILVHGHLWKVLENVDNGMPIQAGRANIFRGELYQLAGYEVLDVDAEVITEK